MNKNKPGSIAAEILRPMSEIEKEISEVKRVSAMPLRERVKYYQEKYGEKTASKTVFCAPLGCYISKPLVKDNSKLKGIWIFDLLAVETCMNCRDCKGFCYAIKSQRQYIAVLLKRSIMTFLAKYFLEWLENCIVNQIKRSRSIRFIRIHSAGDFFSQAYINTWSRIAKQFPKIKLYYYTKIENILDVTALNMNANVNMVSSILPDGEINFGKEEKIHALVAKYAARGIEIHVCPYHDPATGRKETYINKAGRKCTRTVFPEIHCGKDCTFCMDHKYVVFFIH